MRPIQTATSIFANETGYETEQQPCDAATLTLSTNNNMHFAARSALLASCFAISVHALPVTYSVVDVDGGSAAATSVSSTDQAATIYHTMTKSTEVNEPEATTATVSITVVETKMTGHTSADVSSSSSTASSSSSTSSPLKASAQASSTVPASYATATASSTFKTHHTSKPSLTAEPATTQASHSSEDCDATSVTVTADETIVSTQVSTQGGTVTLLSTTTIVDAEKASSTSYYDDGMWHTRYAIKPSASAEVEKPAPKIKQVIAPVEKEPETEEATAPVANNATSNGTYHARRQVDAIPATPTASEAVGSAAPLMFVHPFIPQASGIAARAVPSGVVAARAAPSGVLAPRAVPSGAARAAPSGFLAARAEPSGIIAARAAPTGVLATRALPTGVLAARADSPEDAAADLPDILSADADPTAAGLVGRAVPTGYSVVSWNETSSA